MSREIARQFRDMARFAVAEALGTSEQRPFPPREPPPGPWTVERAYAYCEELVQARAGTFPLASRLVRAEIRPHLLALYAFARSANDFADDPAYEGRRREALDHWEEQLRRSCHGEATHPVFVALADTITRRNLPIPPLEDLLSGFRADMDVRRYATFEELRGYAARSTVPLGRLLLALFGHWQPEFVRFADELSTALQLTRFWRDVASDAARDRIYIPAEDLHFFGVSEADVKAGRPTKALRDLFRFEVARTRTHYERGRPLLDALGSDLCLELSILCLAGTTLLDKLEAADFDVFLRRSTRRRRDEALAVGRNTQSWASLWLRRGAISGRGPSFA